MWILIAGVFVILTIILTILYRKNEEKIIRLAQIVSMLIASFSFFFTVISQNDEEVQIWKQKAYSKSVETEISNTEKTTIYLESVTSGKIESITASSCLEEQQSGVENINYFADNIIDKNHLTAWVEGVEGNGIGEWIEIIFDQEYIVNGIEIANGYQKSKEIYNNNSRIKNLRITFSNGTNYETILVDQFEEIQNIILPQSISTESVKFEILDVYIGDKYEDTCITEMSIY